MQNVRHHTYTPNGIDQSETITHAVQCETNALGSLNFALIALCHCCGVVHARMAPDQVKPVA